MASMEVSFPGGLVVEAAYKGMTVRTDQPVAHGGTATAPAPFDLFLVSIATCAGLYALRFCEERSLPTAGLSVGLDPERDPESGRIARIKLEIRLPEGFPDKYRAAIVRAADLCAVKKHIAQPPAFETVAVGHEVAVPA